MFWLHGYNCSNPWDVLFASFVTAVFIQVQTSRLLCPCSPILLFFVIQSKCMNILANSSVVEFFIFVHEAVRHMRALAQAAAGSMAARRGERGNSKVREGDKG